MLPLSLMPATYACLPAASNSALPQAGTCKTKRRSSLYCTRPVVAAATDTDGNERLGVPLSALT